MVLVLKTIQVRLRLLHVWIVGATYIAEEIRTEFVRTVNDSYLFLLSFLLASLTQSRSPKWMLVFRVLLLEWYAGSGDSGDRLNHRTGPTFY